MTTNMENIDLALATIYGVVNHIPSVIGRCSFQHCSESHESMLYHLQLVSEGYLKQGGAFVDFRVLNLFVI